MSNVTRNHKDNVFCLLYSDKRNLLSLYNAVNGTSYENEEDLEVVTLDEAICMKIRNDAAFVIGSRLNLYEQQASVNPNMPLRDLYYVVEELKKIAPPGRLHSTGKILIPTPKFIVFYNGTAPQPERQVYKLSDLFSKEEEEPELELIVTVININRGYGAELLEKCESLRGYVTFVEKVRDKRDAGVKMERAVSEAVEECISEGILAEFFREHKKEIVEMGIYEFDQEVYDQVLREDGERIGIEIGVEKGETKKLVELICRKLRKGKEPETIAKELEEDISEVRRICSVAKKYKPDYDVEKILQKLSGKESGI